MKTTKSITLTLAVVCALGASALAAPQTSQKAKMSGTKTQKTEKSEQTAKTWDDQKQPMRTVGYPVVFLERTGHSIIRSPQIVSDTFKGKRNLVSKHGVMTERDMKKGTAKKSSTATETEKSSTATKRG